MDTVWNFLGSRLKEKSTWLGLAAVATAVGTWVSSGSTNWQTLALALFGALSGVMPENGSK